jgi:hypothetical protein
MWDVAVLFIEPDSEEATSSERLRSKFVRGLGLGGRQGRAHLHKPHMLLEEMECQVGVQLILRGKG